MQNDFFLAGYRILSCKTFVTLNFFFFFWGGGSESANTHT
jgi:hypothetical protein